MGVGEVGASGDEESTACTDTQTNGEQAQRLSDSTCHSSPPGSCHSPGPSQSCRRGGDRDKTGGETELQLPNRQLTSALR